MTNWHRNITYSDLARKEQLAVADKFKSDIMRLHRERLDDLGELHAARNRVEHAREKRGTGRSEQHWGIYKPAMHQRCIME